MASFGSRSSVSFSFSSFPPPPFASSDSSIPLIVFAYCGDGIVQSPLEECDEGLRNGQKGSQCTLDCKLPTVIVQNFCGDDVLQPQEECDDGNLRDFDGCSSNCKLERGYRGDCVIQTGFGEQCEPVVCKGEPFPPCTEGCVPDPSCGTDYKFLVSPDCGDGIVGPGEQCDEGPENGGDGCAINCMLPYCGDGFVQGSEECDDGNTFSLDGCSESCTLEIVVTAPPPEYERIPTPAKTPTGPGLIIFLASGAAAGIGLVRRRFFRS